MRSFKWAVIIAVAALAGAFIKAAVSLHEKDMLGIAAAGVLALVGAGIAVLSLHDK